MAHWGADDFLQELSSIQKLANLRPGTDMEANLSKQLQSRLESHKGWTAEQLCRMMEAVQACSLGDASKDNLLKSLEGLACPTMAGQSQVKLQAKPQCLMSIQNYLSAKDWQQMSTCSSWDAAVILAMRLRRLGLTSLKEETKKWCTALLVHVQMQRTCMPPYDDIYRLAEQLQSVFNSCVVTKRASGVTMYPLHPKELGKHFVEQAYDQDDPPTAKEIPDLSSIAANHTPIRSASKLLSWNQQQPGKKGNNPVEFEKMLENFLGRFVGNQAGQQESSSASSLMALKPGRKPQVAPPASLLQTSQSQTAQLETSPAAPEPAPAVPALPSAEPEAQLAMVSPQVEPSASEQASSSNNLVGTVAEPKSSVLQSLEDFEQQAFQSLQGVSQKGKGGGAAQKKPAAAVSVKKPAGLLKVWKKPAGVQGFGCIRCRGNLNGCESCLSPDFKGLRLVGRQAWKEWMENRKLQQKKK